MKRLGRTGWALFIGALLAFVALPFYWMLIAALKTGDEQLVGGNPWWVDRPTLSNFTGLLQSALFGHWMLNTVLVTGATLVISLTASILAAYALAYLGVPFSRGIALGLFATYLLPQGVLFLPLVRMLSRLHLTNSPAALVLTYPSLVIPFGTWILWMFFRSLPRDLIDLGRLDGAGVGRSLRSILLPLAVPTLAAVSLFAVAVVFNDLLYTFAFISSPDRMTLIGGVGAASVDIDEPGFIFAAILLGSAPLALSCAFFADTYARGLGTGIIEA